MLQEMAIISKGIKRVGHKRVSRLMPSRSGDSIRRLINSTQFKLYRANAAMDASKSEQTCRFPITTHDLSLEDDQTAKNGATLHPPTLKPKEVSDDKSQLSPACKAKLANREIEFSEFFERQSNVNPKVSASSRQDHTAGDTQKPPPTFSENFATQTDSASDSSTFEIVRAGLH